MAEAQRAYPGRIRWFASLPWQYPARAVEELARSCDEGAVGVMVLANIAGRSLTEAAFAPIWAEIDRRGLPVLVHPGEPPGADLMDMGLYDLSWSVGFMFDTTLAITRMIFDGFLDRYPDLRLIAAHGGGTLPYLVGRFEKGDDVELPERRRMKARPDRLPASHLLRLHHVRPRRAALPGLGRRRGPGDVRDRLAAPGPRHRGVAREHRRAARGPARGDPRRDGDAGLRAVTGRRSAEPRRGAQVADEPGEAVDVATVRTERVDERRARR